MKPDRSNYEIWLIDWLDGNLDEIRTEKLMAFLEQNPDLKEEAESLSLARLIPDSVTGPHKSLLKKTPADLPASQIEYLSVAYLENDLSDSQEKELIENISGNPDNKKVFELIQNTRLKPINVSYRHKNKLIRESRNNRLVRLTITSLSAAATIAALILSLIFLPRFKAGNNKVSESASTFDTILLKAGIPLREPQSANTKIIEGETMNGKETVTNINKVIIALTGNEEAAPYSMELAAEPERIQEYPAAPPLNITLKEIVFKQPEAELIASNITVRELPVFNDDRSKISRFIARTFRDKLLREEISNDTPLKSYEIAEAGIDGLNKLLGWEMALVKTTNDEGDLKSIYFSSRVLKFNAPVKNEGPSL